MPLDICKECRKESLVTDTTRGQVVCTNCGEVNETNIVVSEPTFEDNGHGGASMIGTHVSAHSTGGGFGDGGRSFRLGNSRNSKEITFEKIRREINERGKQMNMEAHHIEKAFNIYKLAFNSRLTKGRKNDLVIAACLYITCRCDGGNAQYLMIDFSEQFGLDTYELGRTFMHFAKSLEMSLNSIDPCLYIMRFASRLQFGNKNNEVVNTALRVVKRMKRDHLHVGRRPSGLCGAALLFAARHHGFNRKPADIVKIVKVHESTLRKRMIEFGETPSSMMKFEDFMVVDLEEEQDPPSFKDARRKDRQKGPDGLDDEKTVYEVSQLRQQIEQLLSEKRGRGGSLTPDLGRRKRKRTATDTSEFSNYESDVEDSTLQKIIDESTLDTVAEYVNSSDCPRSLPTKEDLLEGPTLEMMGLGARPVEPQEPSAAKAPESGELEFDDLDDDELDFYILSKEERIIKYQQWMAENEDYVKAQEEKLAQEERDRLEGKPEKKKRKAPRKKNASTPCSTAGEAIEKMLKEKKLSQKINYDVLKQLRENAISSSAPGPDEKSQALAPSTLMPPPSSIGLTQRKIHPKVEPKVKQEPNKQVKQEEKLQPQSDSADEYKDDDEEEDQDTDGEEQHPSMLGKSKKQQGRDEEPMSMAAMLRQAQNEDEGQLDDEDEDDDDDYY